MSAGRPKRAFGFGCRETPDVDNKFLEKLGFYRKHTATDSSSLFRVVSELHYDIQRYHGKVRHECVKFMRSNRAIFAKDIKHSYDTYVQNIQRPRTYGGLLELKALALRYKSNVFLFERLTEGKWFLYNPKYKTTWRLFCGRDNHFDAVYTMEYITAAAECQAIVYQVLYEKVLGLPDVEYAVERMLHDPEDKFITYDTDEDGTTIATTPDGLKMQLCKAAENTQCVLMYSHLCHFHNQYSFSFIEEFFLLHGSDEGCRMFIGDYFQDSTGKPNPLLSDSDSSCVRQVLALGITPFPYKAAKSLDPCIYRNVEYDVWQEERAERITELYENDIHALNEKHDRRGKKINPAALAKKVLREQESRQAVTYYLSPPKPEIVPTLGSGPVEHVDLTFAPYPLQQFYIPFPDQYGINVVNMVPSEVTNLAFADNGTYRIGGPGCIYNACPTISPVQFHATPQPPMKHLQPTFPTNESPVVADQLALVPHTLNQPMPNVLMVTSTPHVQQPLPQYYHQEPQQLQYYLQEPQQLQYCPQEPQQQQLHYYNQQQHLPCKQYHRQRHYRQHQQLPLQPQQEQQEQQEQQQQQQQIASSYVPRRLFSCVPSTNSGGESNNRTIPSLPYDINSYATQQTAPVSPFWHTM